MSLPLLSPAPKIASKFSKGDAIVVHHGDTELFLKTHPPSFIGLVITSPPYNLGKEYESRVDIESYLSTQSGVIRELIRVLADSGSLCWQVGNWVNEGEVFPIDIGERSPAFPVTPPFMRVRIRWFGGLSD